VTLGEGEGANRWSHRWTLTVAPVPTLCASLFVGFRNAVVQGGLKIGEPGQPGFRGNPLPPRLYHYHYTPPPHHPTTTTPPLPPHHYHPTTPPLPPLPPLTTTPSPHHPTKLPLSTFPTLSRSVTLRIPSGGTSRSLFFATGRALPLSLRRLLSFSSRSATSVYCYARKAAISCYPVAIYSFYSSCFHGGDRQHPLWAWSWL